MMGMMRGICLVLHNRLNTTEADTKFKQKRATWWLPTRPTSYQE